MSITEERLLSSLIFVHYTWNDLFSLWFSLFSLWNGLFYIGNRAWGKD
jgi:hypothetical protein